MAETTVHPNNVRIKYRKKGTREMPSVSRAQSAAMHSAAEGNSTLGIPKSVGEDYVAADHGRKIKNQRVKSPLAKRVRHARKRGLISDKELEKMHGSWLDR